MWPLAGFWARWPKKRGPEKPLKAFSELGRTWDTPDSVSQSLHPAIDRTGNRRRLVATARIFLAPHSKQRMIHSPA